LEQKEIVVNQENTVKRVHQAVLESQGRWAHQERMDYLVVKESKDLEECLEHKV
jgi:hypothetical protein